MGSIVLRTLWRHIRRMWPPGPFLTVPNLLSLSRIALLPLFVWALITPGHLWLAVALVGYGIVSDLLDGYLARRLGQTSEWGRLLDPLSDKLAVAVGFLFCYFERGLPLWFVALALSRDLAILILAPFASRRSGPLPASVLSGRLAALSLAVVIAVYLFDLAPAQLPALTVATVLLLISSVQYGRRLFRHAD